MLKAQKEFWKKRAEEQILHQNQEKKKHEQRIENQHGWNQRLDEGKWLLKGYQLALERSKSIPLDPAIEGLFAKAQKEKEKAAEEREKRAQKKVLLGDSDEEKEQFEFRKRQGKKTKFQKFKAKVRKLIKTTTGVEIEDWDALSPRTQKLRRMKKSIRSEEIVKKEEEARKELELDENEYREDFLYEQVDRIQILKGAVEDLERVKIPTHHTDAEVKCFYIDIEYSFDVITVLLRLIFLMVSFSI
jgi:hypothetical protein